MMHSVRVLLVAVPLLAACGRFGYARAELGESGLGVGSPDGSTAAAVLPGGRGTDGSVPMADASRLGPEVDAQRGVGYPTEWIAISGGTFDMGSRADANSQPVHAVMVPSFEMTRSEVTVAQYAACRAEGACAVPETRWPLCYWATVGYEDYPVNCVSHDRAQAYCAWAGGRLPSEAEWEYAARSRGEARTFPWGSATASCDLANASGGPSGCGTASPWAVCSIPAGNTEEGLCDMVGNVMEWTLDGWHSDYAGAPVDGSAWAGPQPLVRGGAFNAVAWTATERGVYFGASYSNTFLGFRCVR